MDCSSSTSGATRRSSCRPAGNTGRDLQIIVRPDKIRIWGGDCSEVCSLVSGVIEEVVYLGSVTQFIVRLKTGDFVTIHELNDDLEEALPQVGQAVRVRWAAEHSYVVDAGREDAPLAGDGP